MPLAHSAEMAVMPAVVSGPAAGMAAMTDMVVGVAGAAASTEAAAAAALLSDPPLSRLLSQGFVIDLAA